VQRAIEASLTGTVVSKAIVAGELTKISPPAQAAERTNLLLEVGYRVEWYVTSDGLYIVKIFNDAGEMLDGGGGDDPEEALLEVAEHLLPPRR
jgi:hypothetical protein